MTSSTGGGGGGGSGPQVIRFLYLHNFSISCRNISIYMQRPFYLYYISICLFIYFLILYHILFIYLYLELSICYSSIYMLFIHLYVIHLSIFQSIPFYLYFNLSLSIYSSIYPFNFSSVFLHLKIFISIQGELQLLERVFFRLGMAETDEQLQVGHFPDIWIYHILPGGQFLGHGFT